MVKIDRKDKLLLYNIDFDSRKTYAELAKKLLMSKRGVEYKIQNLERKGIILGYTPVIDLSKLGYYYFRVFIKFQNLSKELKKEIAEFIQKEKGIGWAIWAYDAYDIGINVWAKNVKEFKDIINRFYFKFDSHIKERAESVGIEVKFFRNRYLLNDNSTEHFCIGEKRESEKLLPIDKKLLKEIIKNPKAKITDISERLEESPQSISYRLKRLKSLGILLGIRPILNHTLLNKTYYKLFIDLNNINERQIKDLENYVACNSRITYTVSALGICDFDVELVVSSPEELFTLVEDIQEKFPNIIRGYKTLIFDKTIKARFLPADF